MPDQTLPAPERRRNVLIFNPNILAYSETFIPAQAEQFKIFTPYYTGIGRVEGGQLPDERTLWPAGSERIAKWREFGAIFGRLDPWLAGAIRKVNPGIVHAHFEFGGILALPIARMVKAPLVVSCHGVDVTDVRHQWHNWPLFKDYYLRRRRKLLATAVLFIGISRFICDAMLRRGYPPDKVRLHSIGVDTEKFRPDPTFPKEPMLLFVGRMVEKKGCIDLLRAMKKVNARYPEVKLNLIGYGLLREELESFARDAGVNVQFLGPQRPEVVQHYLKRAMMLCVPSVRAAHGDSEGLGIVNLEAQASGVPVVGTLHGGIPEAVEHGVTGLLSPERDPDALAGNILALLSDSALREKMGRAARERVVRHFDLKQQSALLEKIYLELL